MTGNYMLSDSLVPRSSLLFNVTEKREGLGDNVTVLSVGKINRWNAVNGLFKCAFEVAIIQAP